MTVPVFPLIGYDDMRVFHRRGGIFEHTNEARWLAWKGLDVHKCEPYVRQVSYRDGRRKALALGFKNNSGGFDLRIKRGDEDWQGRAGPLDVTFLPAKEEDASLLVFAQFPEFLTYLSCKPQADPATQHFLILNDDSLAERGALVASAYPAATVQVWSPTMDAGLPIVEKLLPYFPHASIGTAECEYEGHASLIAWRAAQLLEPYSGLSTRPGHQPRYNP